MTLGERQKQELDRLKAHHQPGCILWVFKDTRGGSRRKDHTYPVVVEMRNADTNERHWRNEVARCSIHGLGKVNEIVTYLGDCAKLSVGVPGSTGQYDPLDEWWDLR